MSDEQIAVLQQRSWELQDQGRLAEAAEAGAAALHLVETTGGGDSLDAANLLNELSELQLELGDLAAAVKLARRAQSITARAVADWPAEDAARIRLKSCALLGELLRTRGDLGEAETACRAGLELALAQFGAESPEVAEARNNLAVLFKTLGHHAEALALYHQALDIISRFEGADSLAAGSVLHNLGGILHVQGECAAAEPHGRRAWEISRAHLGEHHPRTLQDRVAHAAILDGLEQHAESEAIYREVLDAWRQAFGSRHPEVAATLHNLAATLESRGQLAEAEDCYREALSIRCVLLDDDAVDIALTRNNLGQLLLERGALEEARSLLARAVASLRAQLTDGHPWRAAAEANLAAAQAAH